MPSSGEVASGELWGYHWMPAEIELDCLLPNGIVVQTQAYRETTLLTLKEFIWNEAKKYPLYHTLTTPNYYVFAGVTLDKQALQEFYDESRRLCDLRLFHPVLAIQLSEGNVEEKRLDYEIGVAIGKPVSAIEEFREDEAIAFRKNILGTCKQAYDKRLSEWGGLDLYTLSLEEHNENSVKFIKRTGTCPVIIGDDGDICEVYVSVWNKPDEAEAQKVTLRVPASVKPDELIRRALLLKSRKLSVPRRYSESYLNQISDTYILKVAGRQSFLFYDVPILHYKYIKTCITEGCFPDLMLKSREALLASIRPRSLVLPSYVRRYGTDFPNVNSTSGSEDWVNDSSKEHLTMWELDGTFNFKVRSAGFVNSSTADFIFVDVGIFHGLTLLHQANTKRVPSDVLVWDEKIDFESVHYIDIPCSAQLCFSICGVKQRKQKEDIYPIAWANVRIIDFRWCMVQGTLNLHLWRFSKNSILGDDGTLKPMGRNGSNPNPESPCLYLEFPRFDRPVIFPPRYQIVDFVNFRKTQPSGSISLEKITDDHRNKFDEISKRDPTHEMDEPEKEFMWSIRAHCFTQSECLPRLLDSVNWCSREEFAEVYMLLESWPDVKPSVALELLDIKYPDKKVRSFALGCLDRQLSSEELLLYLICLVQVLKYEPHYDNDLVRFLLKRSLLNRNVGRCFFWIVRSEIAYNPSDLRYVIVLEAFCRASSGYLSTLVRQVDAVRRLETVNMQLKENKDDGQKSLADKIRDECLEKLQHIESPLDGSDHLAELDVDRCRMLTSAKRPIWLVWQNPDSLAHIWRPCHEIIFKQGDDLRQDMLTMQVLKLIDSIWKEDDMDLQLTPYGCVSMGFNYGMIEVVQNSKTVMKIQTSQGILGTGNSSYLYNWLKDLNKDLKYDEMVHNFTASCAGYCVATFVLGIRDRHISNIMITEDGHIFHIDFGHFLGHFKKKFGIKREWVPFVLTGDFIRVIGHGSQKPQKTKEFEKFEELCSRAYLSLHRHSNLFVSLFNTMLCMGIPELQKTEDINHLRHSLAVEMSDEDALKFFQQQLKDANDKAWTTKVDGIIHIIKNREKKPDPV